ncbi:MAG: hypothetical protein H9535_20940 [Ignavibacteria bacterium]|nr:hypothetical protein [Ignavibacteria bacterium]
MKKIIIALASSALVCIQSCASLFSTTTIEPNKSFVLGEGLHAAYDAQIQNVSTSDIDVIIVDNEGKQNSLGLLKVGEQKNYSVPANMAVRFKNTSEISASIKIALFGDSNLSMGYKNNK